MKSKQKRAELSEQFGDMVGKFALDNHLTIRELCIMLEHETHWYLKKHLSDERCTV